MHRLGAMRRTRASTSRMAGDAPKTLPAGSSSAGAGSGLDSAAVCANSRALPIAAPRSSSRTGRATRSAMPRRSASDDASGLRRSATQMTGMLARTTRARRKRSASGRARSRTMTKSVSGCSSRVARTCAACSRRVTVWPRRSSISARPSRSPVSAAIRRTGAGALTSRAPASYKRRTDQAGSRSGVSVPGGVGQPPIGPAVVILVERRRLQRAALVGLPLVALCRRDWCLRLPRAGRRRLRGRLPSVRSAPSGRSSSRLSPTRFRCARPCRPAPQTPTHPASRRPIWRTRPS